VYDSNSDKYIVKQMEFSDISGEIDGGIFWFIYHFIEMFKI
jgi:hypothetical protein